MFWAGRKGLPVSAKKFHFKFRFSFSPIGTNRKPVSGCNRVAGAARSGIRRRPQKKVSRAARHSVRETSPEHQNCRFAPPKLI